MNHVGAFLMRPLQQGIMAKRVSALPFRQVENAIYADKVILKMHLIHFYIIGTFAAHL